MADADDLVTAPAVDTTEGAGAPRRGATTELPTTIDRFEVKAKLGEGGMGVVLLAADPLLGRRVAIKVLHADGADHSAAQRRLLREAQGMAQLSHDNVIVVHEVGTHEGRVFLAMEYVTGGTLTRHQVGRPWREVLDLYLRAGRGLLAAHDAGLVHRDFKPDNVLVGDDGRVRVTDFGLVAAIDASPEATERRDLELSIKLTQTGAVMGTPRYMAPEQHLGESVDPRADQFAFCVALYEALYGHAPFPGPTYPELRRQVLAGEIAPAPARTEVPRHVHAALMRGLCRDRDARWPSMRALLAALTDAPRRLPRITITWTRLIVTIVLAVVGERIVDRWFHADSSTAVAPSPAAASPLASGSPIAGAATAGAATHVSTPAAKGFLPEAQQAFDQAQADYIEGRYDQAAQGFQKAYASSPFPQFLYNVGASYQMLAKHTRDVATYAKAIASYRRYLAEDPQAQDRAQIEEAIAALQAEVERLARVPSRASSATVSQQDLGPRGDVRLRGLVVIDSDPPGATIRVDEKVTPFGTTPWSGWLEGKHHIVVELAGHIPLERDVVIDPKKLFVFHAVLGTVK
ncbi:MAG: protein kinase [Deltaproteobacteria bacterium]|nr:protein kinase [Deltaproteobacteria bacterium]